MNLWRIIADNPADNKSVLEGRIAGVSISGTKDRREGKDALIMPQY